MNRSAVASIGNRSAAWVRSARMRAAWFASLATIVLVNRGLTQERFCHCLESPKEVLEAIPLGALPPLDSFTAIEPDDALLLVEYWNAWGRLQEFYSNLSMQGKLEQTRAVVDPSSGVSALQSRITFVDFMALKNQLFRLDVDHLQADGSTKNEFIGVIRPEGQFLIGFDSATQERFLRVHTNNQSDGMWLLCWRSFNAKPFVDQADRLLAPAMLLNAYVSKPERSKTDYQPGRVTGVRRESLDGEEIVSIDYSAQPGALLTVQLLRQRHWALRKLHLEVVASPREADSAGWAYVANVECTYSPNYIDPSLPLLKGYTKVIQEARTADVTKVADTLRESFEVTKIIPSAPAVSLFSIDDILGRRLNVRPEPSRQLWWVLIVNGLLLFLLGAWLLRRRDRRNTAGTKPEAT